MSTIYDKYTYPVKMTKEQLNPGTGESKTPSQHLFFNVDVCETCYITKKYIYTYTTHIKNEILSYSRSAYVTKNKIIFRLLVYRTNWEQSM